MNEPRRFREAPPRMHTAVRSERPEVVAEIGSSWTMW